MELDSPGVDTGNVELAEPFGGGRGGGGLGAVFGGLGAFIIVGDKVDDGGGGGGRGEDEGGEVIGAAGVDGKMGRAPTNQSKR